MLAVFPGLLLADAVAVLANGHYSFIIPAQPETPTAPLSLKRVLLEPRRHYADDYKGVEEENVFGRQWAAWTDAVLTRDVRTPRDMKESASLVAPTVTTDIGVG